MNAAELRGKSESELRDELLALRREQFNLRMQKGINPDAVRSDGWLYMQDDVIAVLAGALVAHARLA